MSGERDLESWQYVDAPLPECWKAVKAWGQYLSESKTGGFDYENNLPFPRDAIFISLVRVLREQDFNFVASGRGQSTKEMRSVLNSTILYLMNVIPAEGEYKMMKYLVERTREIGKKTE